MIAVDLALLACSVAISSWILYGTPLPWDAAPVGPRVLPMLAFLMLAGLVTSTVILPMPGPGVPRPTYGRGLATVMVTLSATALVILGTRIYFSRSLLLVTMVVWAIMIVWHRAARRRRGRPG